MIAGTCEFRLPSQRPARLLLTALLLPVLAAAAAWAGEISVANGDRNLLINVQDALPDDRGTRLLFYTSPDRTQAHVRENCTANFYVLDLQPGLPAAEPRLLAGNFCGAFGMSGTLLSGGDVLIVAGDRVETWRDGSGKVGSWKFSGVDSLHGYWNTINEGNTPLAVARNGNLVMAKGLPRQRNDTETASAVVIGLSADGATRWLFELDEPDVLLGVLHVWATVDGGALLHAAARPMSGTGLPGAPAPPGGIVTSQDRLYRISPSGGLSAPVIVASTTMPDFANPLPMPDVSKDPAALQAFFEKQQALSNIEAVDRIAAHPVSAGIVNVLIRRGSNIEARQGNNLYRIGSTGEVISEVSIEESVSGEGLRNWTDFSVDDGHVALYGSVGTRANRLPQGYLCRIDIPGGRAITRLVPLNELGLAAARSAADEQMQTLENNPAQQPELLSRLGEQLLMVSLVMRSRRAAIQLDEATEQLAVFTEGRN